MWRRGAARNRRGWRRAGRSRAPRRPPGPARAAARRARCSRSPSALPDLTICRSRASAWSRSPACRASLASSWRAQGSSAARWRRRSASARTSSQRPSEIEGLGMQPLGAFGARGGGEQAAGILLHLGETVGHPVAEGEREVEGVAPRRIGRRRRGRSAQEGERPGAALPGGGEQGGGGAARVVGARRGLFGPQRREGVPGDRIAAVPRLASGLLARPAEPLAGRRRDRRAGAAGATPRRASRRRCSSAAIRYSPPSGTT